MNEHETEYLVACEELLHAAKNNTDDSYYINKICAFLRSKTKHMEPSFLVEICGYYTDHFHCEKNHNAGYIYRLLNNEWVARCVVCCVTMTIEGGTLYGIDASGVNTHLGIGASPIEALANYLNLL